MNRGILLPLLFLVTCSRMALAGHHFESQLAKDHPEYDMTDVFVFRAQEVGKTTVVLCINPTTTVENAAFGTSGLYSFHAGADRECTSGLTVTFKYDGTQMHLGHLPTADPKLGQQGKVMSSGKVGETVVCPSGIRWWTGSANEPFYGNGLGLRAFKDAINKGEYKPELFDVGDKNNILFAGKHSSVILMEIPNKLLGEKIYYYATSAWHDHDHWHQVNRIAHVLMPYLYLGTPEEVKAINEGRPVTDAMRREWAYTTLLKYHRASGYSDAEASERATAVADAILPDVVPYIIGTEAHYGIDRLNGRKLSDDAMDTALELLTGRYVDDTIHSTGQYQHVFPYVLPSKN